MKKTDIVDIITILGLCLLIFLGFFSAEEPAHEIYPRSAIVTEIEETLVTVTDFSGRMYAFYDEIESWEEGDICAMIMDDNGTPETVYDDLVIQARYCGYVY